MHEQTTIPHFMVPMQLAKDGVFAVVEQDSEADIRQCVLALVQTEVGSRQELPDYGVPSTVFAETIDTGGIMSAVVRWEPRAVADVSSMLDSIDELTRWIGIDIRQIGTHEGGAV